MKTEGGPLFGQGGGSVEIDETYLGQAKPRAHGHRGGHHKQKVLSLIDRNSGRSRASS
jgi:hypothetical protein